MPKTQLTAQQERLQDDLRGVIDGEVRCDDVAIRLYSTDASLFECPPLGVVFPRNKNDVAATVRYASENGVSIHPRGAGTGHTGACLGHGLILDFTKYMRRVLQVTENSVITQPGATLERINRQLLQQQRRIGADSGFTPATAIGSVLAVDGAGSHWLSQGFPYQAVRKLQAVLSNGEIVTLERGTVIAENTSFAGQITQELANFLALPSAVKAIADQRSQAEGTPYRQGYRVCNAVLLDGQIDLTPLLIGSEGTLALITQAEIETSVAPNTSGMVFLMFDSLDKAMHAVPLIRVHHPAACELIDRRRLTLLRDWDSRLKSAIPYDSEAVLAVEFEGDDPLSVGDRMQDLINELRFDRQLCYTARVVFQPQEVSLYRDFTARSHLAAYRMRHSVSSVLRLEDAAVPIEQLSSHILAVQNLFKRYELAPSFFGHVGHGQIGVQPVLDFSDENALSRMYHLLSEYYDEVFRVNGSISSEQAFGWIRSSYLPAQFAKYYYIYEQVKRLFDPQGLFHPGKIVARNDLPPFRFRSSVMLHQEHRQNQETTSQDRTNVSDVSPTFNNNEGRLQRQLEVQLKWDSSSIAETTMRCNGCGRCRSREPQTRMCPVFRWDLNEESAPRAKANLVRGILDGKCGLGVLTSEQSRAVADYCVHCHICRLECPTEVNIPKIAFQTKCAFTAAHGLPLSDNFFSHLDQVLKWLALISCPVNWTITNRWTRWLYEKLLGISQARKLPKLAKISYLSRAGWYKRLSKPSRRRDRKVALFVDIYANHFETRIADAAVKVLEHNGIDVYVPGRQQPSGMFSFSCGRRDRAERISRKNISLLADIVRQGYQIITLEPTSAICLRDEYGYLYNDSDALLVAANTCDVMTYLHKMHLDGKLQLNFSPIHTTVGYHAPCRSLVLAKMHLSEQTPAEQLLHLIPGLTVRRLEHGCCGMAGSFGILARTFRRSLRMGMPLFSALRAPSIMIGASECNLCKMQMEQGCNKCTLHPIILMAHAYGFLPDIAQVLASARIR
ncbi:MAG: FAD-binding protein [Planctomycetaceae bacterium]|jgi:FAD/FMN-containing dehydrogenase/Fe-S oxidoreductase|nr:FAD-binding protein [Planctomycetaceae bacterium]